MSRFFEFRVPIWSQIIRSVVVFLSTFSRTSIQDKAKSPHVLCHTYTHIRSRHKQRPPQVSVPRNERRGESLQCPHTTVAGRTIYLTRSLIHVGKSRRCVCVCVCVCVRALQQLDLSVGPQNYTSHKPFIQATD